MTRVEEYDGRAAAHRRARDAARRTERAMGIGRLACFLVAVTQIAALVYSTEPPVVAWALTVASLAAFVGLIARHAAVRERARLFTALERYNRNGVHRVRRRWDELPPALPLAHEPGHAFADDLLVAGAHSLARLLTPVSRAAGEPILSDWLLAEAPPPLDSIHARQRAIAELAPRVAFRERLCVLAGRIVGDRATLETFLAWAEGGDRSVILRRLRWGIRALTLLTLAALAGALLHRVPASVVVVLIVVNVALSAALQRELARVLNVVAGHDWRLRGLADVFRLVGAESFEAPRSAELARAMGGADGVAAFASFDRLSRLGEVRLSPMGHFVLQSLTLWDFHVVEGVERWRAAHGTRVRERLRALGELEALASLSTLGYDNPTWTVPSVEERATLALAATDLAHPLLPAGEGIGNDVTIGAPGDILLITGSNMSGKSTLLRSIGLNVVLAQLGAPVCAASMTLSPHRVRTSIDARDALDRGLSLFMAELLRIKSIVDAARVDGGAPLLYIADEILRGTNATDRHAAIVTILERLVAAGAVGVVATHDPDLANDADLQARLHPFHFIEHFDPARTAMPMWFDYKLRPGLSTTRNAIRLLELVGLT